MTVKVASALFKQAISEMSALFKHSEQYRAFNMDVNGMELYISANTGLRYETRVPLTTPCSEHINVNLIYQDISELLGARGEIVLDFTPASCTVRTGVFEVTFTEANDSVTPLRRPIPSSTYELSDMFTDVCKSLTNTMTFRKAYKLTPLLTFNGNKSYVKFPTVWIEVNGGYIHKTFTMETTEVIAAFAPTSFIEEEDTVTFYKGQSSLMVQGNAPEENTFDRLAADMKKITEIDVSEISIALRKISKVLGDGQVTMFLGPSCIKLQVMRVGVHSLLSFGDASTITTSVQLPLEFVQAVFSILNGRITIYNGGGRICLMNSSTRILMSVGN